MDSASLSAIFYLLLATLLQRETVGELPPEFVGQVENVTAIQGREAVFTCSVRNLRGYRVAWIRADNKAIQAIHDNIITHNPRVSVSWNDNIVWKLHIKAVQESDQGPYMCQINTDPMRSQVAYLDIHVPPDIINSESSGDVTLQEGGSTELRCRANGIPEPIIKWRRETDQPIFVRHDNSVSSKAVLEYVGNVLPLRKVTRDDMGSYYCIASNGVRPAVSKRINVAVQFPPTVTTPHQLVGANAGSTVTLECNIQAYPKPLAYWRRTKAGKVMLPMTSSSLKHETIEIPSAKPYSEIKLRLTIKNLNPSDFEYYYCVAKNTFGDAETSIRLQDTKPSHHNKNGNQRSNKSSKSKHNHKMHEGNSRHGNLDEDDDEIIYAPTPKEVNLFEESAAFRNFTRSENDHFMSNSAEKSGIHVFLPLLTVFSFLVKFTRTSRRSSA